ncbi:MAG: NUDIX domain-containing protein [Candidatus Moranbacteria bacterium]|nr:NUDIX domain-containing protein [Candidatus Moranbacteria bacterium]
MEITRHFTVTTTIVCKNKVLLHFHKSLNIWIPIGGHIDRDELPEEAAVREAKEEAGLVISLYNSDKEVGVKDVRQLIMPMHVMLHDINKFHQHIDFSFYATADTFDLKPADGETNNLKWFLKEEIEKEKMPDNAKILALEALRILGSD